MAKHSWEFVYMGVAKTLVPLHQQVVQRQAQKDVVPLCIPQAWAPFSMTGNSAFHPAPTQDKTTSTCHFTRQCTSKLARREYPAQPWAPPLLERQHLLGQWKSLFPEITMFSALHQLKRVSKKQLRFVAQNKGSCSRHKSITAAL